MIATGGYMGRTLFPLAKSTLRAHYNTRITHGILLKMLFNPRLLNEPPQPVEATARRLLPAHVLGPPVGLRAARSRIPVPAQRLQLPAVVDLAFPKLGKDHAFAGGDGIFQVHMEDALDAHLFLDPLVPSGEDLAGGLQVGRVARVPDQAEGRRLDSLQNFNGLARGP